MTKRAETDLSDFDQSRMLENTFGRRHWYHERLLSHAVITVNSSSRQLQRLDRIERR